MIDVTFSFPWKKAFWELSLPLIRSTRSESLIVSVTSGLAENTNVIGDLEMFGFESIDCHKQREIN